MILLIQNIEDYNNDFRVSLQAFYGGERIIVPEIFEKKPELKREVDKVFAADIREQSIEIKMYAGTLEDDGKAELAEEIKNGLEIRPTKGVRAGFRLAAKDGSGYFDCSDDEIMQMLMPYFRDLDF